MATLDLTVNELAFLSAVVYLGTAVLESNMEKIDDGVTMLKVGYHAGGVFSAQDILALASKVTQAVDETLEIRRMLDGMANAKLRQ